MTSTGLRDRAAELLPSPFCGCDAHFWQNTVDFLPVWDVYCGGCDARVECCAEGKEDAAIDWNTRALLASPAPAGAEGWVLVPKEPTPEMCSAFFVGWQRIVTPDSNGRVPAMSYWRNGYDEMLAASPAPSPATPPAEARDLVERHWADSLLREVHQMAEEFREVCHSTGNKYPTDKDCNRKMHDLLMRLLSEDVKASIAYGIASASPASAKTAEDR